MTQDYLSRHGASRHNVKELLLMLDEHLAWSAEAEERSPALNRRGSAGTLVVDWDGVGEPQISYRGQRRSRSSQAGNLDPTIHANEPPKPTAQIEERHYQELTKAPRAKMQHSDRSLDQSDVPEGPPPPLLKRSAPRPQKVKSHGHHNSTQPHPSTIRQPSSTKPLSSTGTHHRSRDAHYGRVPSNHKSAHTSAYNSTNPSINKKHSRPRSDSTIAQYHRDHEADHLYVHYNPSTNRVHGHDPNTGYAYDYNGRIVHIHHSPTSSVASRTSEYYIADVRAYKPKAPMKVLDKPLPPAPSLQVQKSDKIERFVEKVLRKLDGMGILGRMRQQREERRRSRESVGRGYGA
ncbi:hypothetical protein BKA63DRAFT_134298 [Paraphoma chrysanthemicola]|nr:hypothetical protein BKA63DRAFT_134298 [Paraphoma chrysanthemicola]